MHPGALITVVLIAVSACSEMASQPPERPARYVFDLQLVASYGLPLAELDTVPAMNAADGGGVLLSIASAALGPDSCLYVLDSYFRKIVVFGHGGPVRRVILGGFGEGPGEFLAPRDLAVDRNGAVWVADASNGRVTAFTSTGEYSRSFRVPDVQIHRITTHGKEVWLSLIYVAGNDEYSSMVFDHDGNSLHHGFRVTGERERDAASTGNPGIFAKSPGAVLFALGDPGQWIKLAGAGLDQQVVGTSIFPNQRIVLVPGSRPVLLATTRGVGILPGGEVALMYGHIDPSRTHTVVAVDFFEANGSYLGTAQLDSSFAGSRTLVTSPTTGHLYIDRRKPYPHIDEFRVDRTPIDAAAGPLAVGK